MANSKAVTYGLLILGTASALHFGSGFLKSFVTTDPMSKKALHEKEFLDNLKKI